MEPENESSKAKRGATPPTQGKTRITIFIDDAILDEFRSRAEKAGFGYQTMMNNALKIYLEHTDSQPLTETILRRVIREEFLRTSRITKRTGGRLRTR